MSRWLRELHAQNAAPTRSGLVARLNDPYLIAVVLFCLICLVVIAGRLRWNEWYVATHAAAVETPGQVIAGSREDAELQARSVKYDMSWCDVMRKASWRVIQKWNHIATKRAA